MTNWLRAVQYFLWWFVAMLALFWWVTYFMASKWIQMDSNWIYIFFAAQQLVTLVIVRCSLSAWGWKWIEAMQQYFNERAQWKGRWLFVRWVIWWFIVYMIINWLLFTLLDYFSITIPWMYWEQWVMSMLEQMNLTSSLDWFMIFLMIVIVGPLVEELVYRGLITDVFMKRWKWRGVVSAAFIFALIHFEFAVFWNLFLLALILWVIYYKTESMRYTFAFHVIINGMWFLILWLTEMGYVPWV